MRPNDPSHFSRDDQQDEIDHPEQEHGVRHIMLEEPYHATPSRHIIVNATDT
jgi:hypothetical protein